MYLTEMVLFHPVELSVLSNLLQNGLIPQVIHDRIVLEDYFTVNQSYFEEDIHFTVMFDERLRIVTITRGIHNEEGYSLVALTPLPFKTCACLMGSTLTKVG